MLDLVMHKAGDTEPGFARKTVKWAITCSQEGRFTGIVPLGDRRGRTFDGCPSLSFPELVGGAEPRSHFLAESLATVALYRDPDSSDGDGAKIEGKHAWFLRLLEQASEVAPYLLGAARMLGTSSVLDAISVELRKAGAKPADIATVVIQGINPLDRDDWRSWWRRFRSSLRPPAPDQSHHMRCVVTGAVVDPVATQPKITGLAGVGGLSVGDVLAGFDKSAFQSYGLLQARNAAMSEGTATAYAQTLTRLISERNIKLGNMLVVWWYTGETVVDADDELMEWYREPPETTSGAAEQRARTLLSAIRTGQRADLAGTRFVALMLSGAAGRVMVREVIQGSFEDLAQHTETWFHDLSVVARDDRALAPDPKFMAVAGSLVRDLKDLPSPWLQQLWRAAVTGGPIPAASLAQAVARVRLDVVQDKPASHARMALIKAYLIRNAGDKDMQSHVNPDHPSPAYHCGRAVALFARLQRAALGNVGAGVVQRFYTAAAQTPGLVLGRLAANAKNHLNKLDAGLAWWYENQLAGVMSRIGDYPPRTLTLQEQSLFALGYYQQLAALNAGKQSDSGSSDKGE